MILFCNVLMLILYEYDILSQMLRAQLLRRVMQLRQQYQGTGKWMFSIHLKKRRGSEIEELLQTQIKICDEILFDSYIG